LKIGATLIPLVGWGVQREDTKAARELHLGAVRRLAEERGLQAIELNGDFSILYPHIFDRTYYESVAELQEQLGFACTVHLPFLWLDGISLAEPVRKASVECVLRSVELAKPLLVDSYVLHLWGIWSSLLLSVQDMPQGEKQSLLDMMLLAGRSTLEEVSALLPNHKLCVENLEHFAFDSVAGLIERRGAKICLDVGHLAVSGGDPIEFLEEYWHMIGEIHMHDVVLGGAGRRAGRDHLALGRGCVDYAGLLDRLEERGYDGVVILEVNTENDLLDSLKQVRPWLKNRR
jgi:sugar phosphate isomerase/epimerase